jgi:hypothetical protein
LALTTDAPKNGYALADVLTFDKKKATQLTSAIISRNQATALIEGFECNGDVTPVDPQALPKVSLVCSFARD